MASIDFIQISVKSILEKREMGRKCKFGFHFDRFFQNNVNVNAAAAIQSFRNVHLFAQLKQIKNKTTELQ